MDFEPKVLEAPDDLTYDPTDLLWPLPVVDASPLCCCTIIDSSLAFDEHLDDCEIKLLTIEACILALNTKGSQETKTLSSPKAHDALRRRKHRESMARLRRGWKASLTSLQQQQQDLQMHLRELIALSSPQPPPTNVSFHQAYCALVVEQVQLEEERTRLEKTCAQYEKYKRYLNRELDRIRLFQATPAPESQVHQM